MSFVSAAFVSFGVDSMDVADDGVVIIIVGFSLMVGTICNELPNFTLFSANGFDNVLNERNSLPSAPVSFVHAGNMRRPDIIELVNMFDALALVLAAPPHSGVSILIWNGEVNVRLAQSNCRIFGGRAATSFVRTSGGNRYD